MPVRGWLLLLCILLTVWNPAALALVAASRLESAGTASTLALIVLGVRLAVTSVGLAAGLALWHKRAGAVTLARASLMLSGLEVVARLSTRLGLSAAPPGTRLPLALASIAYYGAWYLYLEKSRRVRATYGLESRPSRPR
jgi:NADH:ubiquinone oxidoreductase subunit K